MAASDTGTKIFVFDLNGVLLYKADDSVDLRDLARVHGRYLSPLTKELREFFANHPCKFVIWSTMLLKNIRKFKNGVESAVNREIEIVFSQEDCDNGPMYPGAKCLKYKKDLRKVARHFGVDVKNCILIDDIVQKRVGDQNFYEYKGSAKELLKMMDNFVECSDISCNFRKK